MRYGENPLAVIDRVKEKIAEISPGLPDEDARRRHASPRSRSSPSTTARRSSTRRWTRSRRPSSRKLIVGVLIVVVFLLHLRSSLAIVSTLPLSVAISFLVMYLLGVDSNIMSLAGLAIAIGDVADMG